MTGDQVDAPETTAEVRRASEALRVLPLNNAALVELARKSLTAALPTECHEEVQGWTEDEAHPCNEPAVAYREDKYEPSSPPYPVCAKHATPDLVPLHIAILGGAS